MFFDIKLLFVIVKFNLKQFYTMNQNYLFVICLISFTLLLTVPMVIMWRSYKRKKQQEMFDAALPFEDLAKNVSYRSLGYRYDVDGNAYMLIQEKENSRSKKCIIPPNGRKQRQELNQKIPPLL